jgi:hypothetical protein
LSLQLFYTGQFPPIPSSVTTLYAHTNQFDGTLPPLPSSLSILYEFLLFSVLTAVATYRDIGFNQISGEFYHNIVEKKKKKRNDIEKCYV